MGCQPGSSESAPCVTWSVLGSPPLSFVPPLPGGRRPLTHSPPREVASRPATRGCPAHGFWASQRGGVVSAAIPCPLMNGGVVHAVVPCGSDATLSQRGWNNNSAQPSRGCLDRLQKVVNVPHHCLETVSVAMHTARVVRLRWRCRRHSTQDPSV